MTKAELEKYRERLEALRLRVRTDFKDVRGEALRQTGGEASGSLSNAPLHTADLGTDNFEQEVALSLLENQQLILDQIGPAIERLENGTYGTCLECGGPIAEARLDALPYTAHCVECAQRLQQEVGPASMRPESA